VENSRLGPRCTLPASDREDGHAEAVDRTSAGALSAILEELAGGQSFHCTHHGGPMKACERRELVEGNRHDVVTLREVEQDTIDLLE